MDQALAGAKRRLGWGRCPQRPALLPAGAPTGAGRSSGCLFGGCWPVLQYAANQTGASVQVAATVSVVIPTYNERDNVARLCQGVADALSERWPYEIIVVDDNSPDGTANVVRALAARDSRTRLIQRSGKLGLGSAVVEGFRASSGDVWMMMDADLSHRPQDIPRLLEGLEGVDVAIGSRYVKGGRTVGWSFIRLLGSRSMCLLARWWLGLKPRDVTAGFVAYRRESLEPLLDYLNPHGFKLLLEILVAGRWLRVREVPITFVERASGRSKMGLHETLSFLRLCWRLKFQAPAKPPASVARR